MGTSALTREGHLRRRLAGLVIGTVPFGFIKGERGELHPHGLEQRTIDEILEKRSEGWGYKKIATHLDRIGYAPRGKRWYPQGIKSIIATTKRWRTAE